MRREGNIKAPKKKTIRINTPYILKPIINYFVLFVVPLSHPILSYPILTLVATPNRKQNKKSSNKTRLNQRQLYPHRPYNDHFFFNLFCLSVYVCVCLCQWFFFPLPINREYHSHDIMRWSLVATLRAILMTNVAMKGLKKEVSKQAKIKKDHNISCWGYSVFRENQGIFFWL